MEIRRKCTKCNKIKLPSCFNKCKHGKYGLRSICRDCDKIQRKERYWNNREEEIKRRIEWRKKSKENQEKDKASHYRWKQNNPDTYKECWKRYNKNHRISVLEKVANGKELKCIRCNCDVVDLLEINHKNGGGLKEVKRQNTKFYSKILSGERKTGDLELLCRMCNILHYVEMKFGSLSYKLTWRENDKM